ncbi:RM34 protein, partial [Crypturellus soui]|nr:RM34 protein [Crypturellus soui]NXA42559.1 RM34 protein [Eudromia elegans]
PASAWSLQQVRTKARGNTYQPNNRKRKRTHGWIKRISTPAGIEVILRRMLKGRKSLSH